LHDYGLSAGNRGLAVESIGYVISAVIGIALVASIMYIITKLLGRKNGSE
jgi:hypothetical protein